MQLFTLSRSNLFSTNERTNEKRKIRRHRSKTHRYPATFVPLRITRNKLAARNARSDLNRAPTEALLSLGGERSGLRRTRNPIDTNWEYDDSARFRRVSSRRRGGGGVCWVTEKFTKAAIIGSFCGQSVYRETMGNNTNNRG